MKNYENQELHIPSYIWNDKKLNGIQKMMIALYTKIQRNTPVQTFYPKKQAQIFDTHVKDIVYNFEQLIGKGYITLTQPASINENTPGATYIINSVKPTYVKEESNSLF